MEHLLHKGKLVNSSYEIQFFIGGDTFCEKYRVKGKDSKTYLLKLYNSSKLSRNDFLNNNLFEVEILSQLNLKSTIKLIDNGEYVHNNNRYHYVVLDFIS